MSDYGPCPSCGGSWRGDPIPEASRELYGTMATHFSKLIAIELRGVYDGAVINKCPACGVMRHRFSGEFVNDELIRSGRVTREGVMSDE